MRYIRIRRSTAFLAVAIAGGAVLRAQPGDGVPAEFKESASPARGRYAWHYAKRAFPADTVRQGYLLEGLRSLSAAGQGKTIRLAWQEEGPRPGSLDPYGTVAGRIPALAVHPSNPSIVYAGAADGGVWKTTDGGVTWNPRTDHLASLATGALTLDPVNPATIYWGTGEPYYAADAYGGAGVFMSTDGGESWSPIGLAHEKRVTSLAVSPATGAHIYAATWTGVYRTTDRGESWSRTLAAGYAYSVLLHPTTPSRVFATVGDNASAAGVYRSTDAGQTWTRLAGGLPEPERINRIVLAVARSAPATMYALISARSPFGSLLGLYRTTNGGSTWARVNSVPSDLFGPNNQGWYDIALAVHPTSTSTVFIGGVSLYRSTNSGSSWTDVSGGTVHPDQHAIAFGGTTMYAANDGGVWKSTTGGTAWSNLNARLAITQFYSVGVDRRTPGRIFGGTQDNGTQRGTGSPGWTGVLGGDGGMVVVDPGSSLNVFAETQYGRVYRSTDGGTGFRYVFHVGGAWVTPLRMDPFDAATLYSANTRVLKSTTSGTQWTVISPHLNGSTNIQWLAPDPSAPGRLFAASNQKIFRTTDGGAVWQTVGAGLPALFIEQIVVDPLDPATLYVVYSGTGAEHVHTSTDGGDTWRPTAGGLPDIPTTSLVVSPADRNTLFLGTDLGLWVSTDRGEEWLKETGLPNAGVTDMAVTGDGRLVVATHGRSMFSAPIDAMPPLALVAPAGGETIRPRVPYAIRWVGSGVQGDVRIELLRNGNVPAEVLFDRTPDDGVELWDVQMSPAAGLRLRISSADAPTVAHTGSGAFTVAEPLRFVARIMVRNGGGQVDTLEFGEASGATQGIDPAYGEQELPPPPPSTIFDARWQIAGTQGVHRDVRQMLDEQERQHVFAAVLQSGRGGYPLTFRWDPLALPAGLLTFRDGYAGGALFLVDMKARDSLVITNPALGRVEVTYAEPDTVTVGHAYGWNMISLPVDLPDPSLSALFLDAQSRAFTHTGQGYTAGDSLAAGTGYWVKFSGTTHSFVGMARQSDTMAVSPGWNMIGSVTGPVEVDSILQVPGGVVVSPFMDQEGPARRIEPGRAYWVKAATHGALILRAPRGTAPGRRTAARGQGVP